jgi:hypothetical protein
VTGLLPEGTAHFTAQQLTPEPERKPERDPVEWTRNRLDEFLWSKQREIMRAVLKHRHTAVPAAHDVSKSHTVSRLAAWWVEEHPPGEAFVVWSAPTENQTKAIVGREIARAHRRGGLAGRITLDGRWYVGPKDAEELVAYGRKPADLVDASQAMQSFQGIHARYVLVILDEATGIPPWLWDAAESLATNEGSRIIAIGNPDDPSSRFEEACRPGSGWHVVRIPAQDSPNFTNEWVPEYLRDLLISRTWVEERRQRWGTDSPLYKSKVLAEFPDTSDDAVVTPALIKRAQMAQLPATGRGCYGLDVARFGHDSTQLYRQRGGVIRFVSEWHKADTTETAQRAQALVQWDTPVAIDADGIGGGVYDQLRRLRHHTGNPVWCVAFTSQDKMRNPLRFYTRRSELWWQFRELMEDGAIDLDPEDDDLAAQLQAPKWDMRSGRIRVETKEEMRARGVASPDKADAAIMSVLGSPPEGVRTPGLSDPAHSGSRTLETAGLRTRPM